MTTSPTTSLETRVREALLDVLHAQWREYGVPFETAAFGHPLEVIDPEELLWCSLRFFGTEPRLEEAVRGWCAANRSRLNTQRLNTLARRQGDEPADAAPIAAWRSLEDVRPTGRRTPTGGWSPRASSLHLRARDVLGNDCASYLMVALLGSPRGVRCRDIAEATGYAYRSIADAAGAWRDAGIVRFERGFCTILDPTPWSRILKCDPGTIVTIDWHAAYGAVAELLRTLERAKAAGVDDVHPLVQSAAAKADAELQRAAAGVAPERAPAIDALRRAIRVP